MNENETAYRYVVEAELRDQQRPAHAVAYAGAVAEAVRRSQLVGGGVFTEKLIEVLAADRRAEYAANELGVMACLVAETWVVEQWEIIAARAAVVELPTPLTVTEEQHRRAAVALAAELRDLPAGVSRTAVITLVSVMAAARARWDLSGLDGISTASQQAVISDVLTTGPVAEAAAAELGDCWQQVAGPIMIEHWDEIHERATETATLDAIESAA
ncbi:hypothetical protein E3G71_001036 [Mycobacteroides abscessus]|uniref:hypothetical protein n=1 Tax=Mycobacteroides abscessus TaxID=36809 RepID=UPI0018780212|nr:hypothetical protein [Mycobacteroides abscessus]MBE5488535.1 hypothetical protein [Mycobacteroides abscessus]MBE5518131.1 hypothetical protein [Mycobacteroides abscessus]MBN7310958.1 hypothetical protein [Mycobacteroides abscessus subsp. abscessus]